MNALLSMTTDEFEKLEATIRVGLQTFREVGAALLEIRDRRGYLLAEFTTFEDYCRERWSMERAHAYRLINAAQVIDHLSPIGDTLPANEAQARPLARLAPEDQAAAWQQAIITAPNGQITAAHVGRIAQEWTMPHAQPTGHTASVTYKHQPAIDKTRGAIPLAGNAHIYTVSKVLWPKDVEAYLAGILIGRSLHVCCGMSQLGDVRLDNDATHHPDILCDAANMRAYVSDKSFDTVLCDPPYNGQYQWNHDLLSELARVAIRRIIFQHWFVPANKHGIYKKANAFHIHSMVAWQPRAYFGRAQLISVFDTTGADDESLA